MTANLIRVQIKGTNHKTYVAHITPSHEARYVGTISAYAAGVVTLNTADQVGSSTNGYNGTNKTLTLADAFVVALDNTSVIEILDVYVETLAVATAAQATDIQGRLPASLNNGVMKADIQRVRDQALTGDGSASTPWGPA